jgi:hydroxylaminobenzene mutase
MDTTQKTELSRKLIRYGVVLFLLGLLTGFAIPAMQNPRMGLSSHLEGVQNGMLLMIFGVIWTQLRLSDSALQWGYGLALFGTYTNWLTTFLAGIWGAGAAMMPIAGNNLSGTVIQEELIKFGLGSLSITMLIVCALLIWGLRGKALTKPLEQSA